MRAAPARPGARAQKGDRGESGLRAAVLPTVALQPERPAPGFCLSLWFLIIRIHIVFSS